MWERFNDSSFYSNGWSELDCAIMKRQRFDKLWQGHWNFHQVRLLHDFIIYDLWVSLFTLISRPRSYNLVLVHVLPASPREFSPSTSTHHPSPPTVPPSYPAIVAPGNSFFAYANTASSKLPG